MQYIGVIIILGFFVLTACAFIKDIKYGMQSADTDNPDEIIKKKTAFKIGVAGLIIETLILLYFCILLIYYAFH
jgi:hypothetical protein